MSHHRTSTRQAHQARCHAAGWAAMVDCLPRIDGGNVSPTQLQLPVYHSMVQAHVLRCARFRSLDIETEVFPAATDSSLLRLAGIPALGFSVCASQLASCCVCIHSARVLVTQPSAVLAAHEPHASASPRPQRVHRSRRVLGRHSHLRTPHRRPRE